MLRNLALGLFPLLLALPAQAADKKPTVAVVGIHDRSLDADAQAEAVASLVSAIEAGGRFDALDQDEVAVAIAGREPIVLQESFLGPGRRLLEDGRILYEQAQPDEAIPVLEEAVDTLRTGVASANTVQDLWTAHVYLGTAHLAQGDESIARAAYAQAVALNPARNPNPAQFPPNVVAFYDAVKEERQALAGTLVVEADAPETTVFLNGVDRGLAPVTIERHPPGEVHVVGRGPEGTHAYQLLELPESGRVSASLQMEAPSIGAAADSRFVRSRQAAGLYEALGAHTKANLVLLVGIAEEKLHLQLYSPVTDAFSTPVEVAWSGSPLDEAAENVGNLLRLPQDDGTIPGPLSSPTTIPLDVGANRLLAQLLLNPKDLTEIQIVEVTNRRWLWVGLGGAGLAAVGGGASYYFYTQRAQEERHQGTITVGPVP